MIRLALVLVVLAAGCGTGARGDYTHRCDTLDGHIVDIPDGDGYLCIDDAGGVLEP